MRPLCWRPTFLCVFSLVSGPLSVAFFPWPPEAHSSLSVVWGAVERGLWSRRALRDGGLGADKGPIRPRLWPEREGASGQQRLMLWEAAAVQASALGAGG